MFYIKKCFLLKSWLLVIKTRQKLHEVAAKVGVTASTVHDAEIRGLRTTSAAKRYAKAFPGIAWQELLD